MAGVPPRVAVVARLCSERINRVGAAAAGLEPGQSVSSSALKDSPPIPHEGYGKASWPQLKTRGKALQSKAVLPET